jgi:hypothetical protein
MENRAKLAISDNMNSVMKNFGEPIAGEPESTMLYPQESIMEDALVWFMTDEEAELYFLGQVEKTNDRDFETEHR